MRKIKDISKYVAGIGTILAISGIMVAGPSPIKAEDCAHSWGKSAKASHSHWHEKALLLNQQTYGRSECNDNRGQPYMKSCFYSHPPKMKKKAFFSRTENEVIPNTEAPQSTPALEMRNLWSGRQQMKRACLFWEIPLLYARSNRSKSMLSRFLPMSALNWTSTNIVPDTTSHFCTIPSPNLA